MQRSHCKVYYYRVWSGLQYLLQLLGRIVVILPRIFRGTSVDIIRLIFAIILPPVGVFLQVGIGGQFWINIILTLLGYIPGIVHAVWIIAKR